jgi:hypothetical protein
LAVSTPFSLSDSASERTLVSSRDRLMIWALTFISRSKAAVAASSSGFDSGGISRARSASALRAAASAAPMRFSRPIMAGSSDAAMCGAWITWISRASASAVAASARSCQASGPSAAVTRPSASRKSSLLAVRIAR